MLKLLPPPCAVHTGISKFSITPGPIHSATIVPSRSLALAVPCANVALSMSPQRVVGKLRLRLGHEAGQPPQVLCKQKEMAVERIPKVRS